MKDSSDPDLFQFAVVPPENANDDPYPIVLVTEEGTVQELEEGDRRYMEEFFHPADGARPYVKSCYDEKNGWGNLRGFLQRTAVPKHISVSPEPCEE